MQDGVSTSLRWGTLKQKGYPFSQGDFNKQSRFCCARRSLVQEAKEESDAFLKPEVETMRLLVPPGLGLNSM
jgi:hypothetical protein